MVDVDGLQFCGATLDSRQVNDMERGAFAADIAALGRRRRGTIRHRAKLSFGIAHDHGIDGGGVPRLLLDS